MLSVGTGFYVRVGNDGNRRVLHPAKIMGVSEETYTAELKGERLAMEEGHEFLVYYEIEQKFVKQAARIESVADDGETFMIDFATVGEPASADSRQQFRVSTVVSDLSCSVGDESNCKVLDISAMGISAVVTKEHAIGAILDLEVRHDGQCYAGKVSVQGTRSHGRGLIRCGLLCVDEKRSQANLTKGLRQLTMSFQRQQLRRLAGTV